MAYGKATLNKDQMGLALMPEPSLATAGYTPAISTSYFTNLMLGSHFPDKPVNSLAKATPAEASSWIFISYNQKG